MFLNIRWTLWRRSILAQSKNILDLVNIFLYIICLYFKKSYLDRFPWKLLVHLLLLIMTTMQVLIVVGTRTSHVRSQHQVFKHLFMESEDEVDTVEFNNFGNFQSHLLGLKDVIFFFFFYFLYFLRIQ